MTAQICAQRVPHLLLITETTDLAADHLLLSARSRNLSVIRFNQDDFPKRAGVEWRSVGQTRFFLDGEWFEEDQICGVWFRRPPHTPTNDDQISTFAAREAASYLGGVWETTSWSWMNRPSAVARAEHKLL